MNDSAFLLCAVISVNFLCLDFAGWESIGFVYLPSIMFK